MVPGGPYCLKCCKSGPGGAKRGSSSSEGPQTALGAPRQKQRYSGKLQSGVFFIYLISYILQIKNKNAAVIKINEFERQTEGPRRRGGLVVMVFGCTYT